MNWLNSLNERKRLQELYEMQAMQQMAGAPMLPIGIPDTTAAMLGGGPMPGYGVLAPEAMPMANAAGMPGYGVLQPEAMTGANMAAASGAPGMGAGLPMLLGLASMLAGGSGGGGQSAPAPPPAEPVGRSKDGLPYLSAGIRDLRNRRRRRGLLET